MYERHACSSVKCRFRRIESATREKSGEAYSSLTRERPSGNNTISSASGMPASRSAVIPSSLITLLAVATSR